MKFLELKIPPPLVVLVTGLLMWLSPQSPLNILISHMAWIYLGAALMLLGMLTDAYAAFMFMAARTTISPIAPQNASVLIVHGLFKLTRNPMYLGMAVLLLGWGFVLQNLFALFGPIFFVTYITGYQIIPEERILTEKWKDPYTAYLKQTRRWL